MAQIEKRAEQQYRIRIFLGRVNGKRTFKSEMFHGPRKEAEKKARELEQDKESGLLRKEVSTLDQFLDQWLEIVQTKVAERTFNDYSWLMKKYIRPTLGKLKLSDIQPLHIQALYAKIKHLSPRTIKYIHTVFGSAMRQAVKWRMLKWDPTDGVEIPKAQKKLDIRPLTEEQVAILVEACQHVEYGLVFQVAVTSGLRPEEYLALDWESVDLEAGTLKVVRALLWKSVGKGPHIGVTKTPRARRTVPIPKETVEALKAHRRHQQKNLMLGKGAVNKLNLVFPNSEGGPLDPHNLGARHFKPLLKSCGLPSSFNLYSLRHSWITLALTGEVSLKTVSEWAGHASVAFTLDTYGHLIPSMERRGAEQMKDLFSGILSPQKPAVTRKVTKAKK